jgi:pimeloyl-ACP methyl ester carboxylesterase
VLHYVEHGDGVPLVVLHGAGVDHRDVEAGIEALALPAGYRRIYPDLPGMGTSTAEGLAGNDDVVDALCAFLDHVSPDPVLLAGHSYGGYLARGVAGRRPARVRGLALLCPIGEQTTNVPDLQVVREDPDAWDELDRDQHEAFAGYFVVRTPATARRYRDAVAPGAALADEAALGRIFAEWAVDLGSEPSTAPTLLVAGRRDSVVGYVDTVGLLDSYPHATLAVVDNAGHALIHEQPDVVGALLTDWLTRAR